MDIPFHAAMEHSTKPVTVRSHGKNTPEKRTKKEKPGSLSQGHWVSLVFHLCRTSLVCDCWDGRVKEFPEQL
jgi:hypothetical protein